MHEALKARRLALGYSINRAASLSKLSFAAIKRLETGGKVTPQTVEAYADFIAAAEQEANQNGNQVTNPAPAVVYPVTKERLQLVENCRKCNGEPMIDITRYFEGIMLCSACNDSLGYLRDNGFEPLARGNGQEGQLERSSGNVLGQYDDITLISPQPGNRRG